MRPGKEGCSTTMQSVYDMLVEVQLYLSRKVNALINRLVDMIYRLRLVLLGNVCFE